MNSEPPADRSESSIDSDPALRRLYEQFFQECRDGISPRIEDYLSRVDELQRQDALVLFLTAVREIAAEIGQPPPVEEYCRRFPDASTLVKNVLLGDIPSTRMPSKGDLPLTSTRRETGDDSRHDAVEPAAVLDDPPATAEEAADEGDGRTDKAKGSHPPRRIGRFQIKQRLGGGAVGDVYQAYDPQLQRDIALKVPSRRLLCSGGTVEAFLDEARAAAKFSPHSGIVTIHEVGRHGDLPYIVQQWIQGPNLDEWHQAHRPRLPGDGDLDEWTARVVKVMVAVAGAVGHAHQYGIWHRDLKPANILIDANDEPRVTDFGLALHEGGQWQRQGEASGTPPYMSPEQVRGESHLLDGRSDIFSLGAVLYELLVGQRAFSGSNPNEVYEKVLRAQPKPLRLVQPALHAEMERICLKCLQERATDRYGSTRELIEDLQTWLNERTRRDSPPLPTTPAIVVPKGLNSYDASDSDFFLQLLPGPRDRDGLPNSIRFWKSRIEQRDADETFRVGLIYGRSGCGKSSFVKAGLLPQLSAEVIPIYLEATPEQTESQLRARVAKRFPDIDPRASLTDMIAHLRQRPAVQPKVLLILDHFEQWLHAHLAEEHTKLVTALRQCDGGQVQALVMVRDDFWMAVSSFMQQLEVPILEGHNSGAVHLFDQRHATRVLQLFGRAHGQWPVEGIEPTREQQRFVKRAIEELSQEGRVVCVRLALFAEMLQDKPWTSATLRDVGGIGGVQGVGIAFLDETFNGTTVAIPHRNHKDAACRVLAELLPATGTDIKGEMRSREQLRVAAKYQNRPADFDTLLGILDEKVRLITPTEPAASTEPSTSGLLHDTTELSQQGEQYYQLTHDYLVPSLRAWLTREKGKSHPGRAELVLEERTAYWKDKRENQQLPSLLEYARIARHVHLNERKRDEREMMGTATRYYGWRTALAALLLVFLAWGGREAYSRWNAQKLVTALMKSSPQNLAASVTEIRPYLPWASSALRHRVTREVTSEEQRKEQLHARLALVAADDTHVPPLRQSLLSATPQYIGVIRDILSPYADQVRESLWETLHDESADEQRRFRAGLALATYEPDAEAWSEADYLFLVDQLLSSFAEYQGPLRDALRPLAPDCLPTLEKAFRNDEATTAQREAAALAIADFASQDQQRTAEQLSIATPRQYAILYPLVADGVDVTVKHKLAETAATLPPEDMGTLARIPFGKRRAGAAITLLRLGERKRVLPVFDLKDDPEALTQFIFRCKPRAGCVRMNFWSYLISCVGRPLSRNSRSPCGPFIYRG